jgi:hypothetical protein
MRNVSEKVVEKIKTYFTFNNVFFFENCGVYEIMWKKYGRQARDDNIITAQKRFAFHAG